MKHLPPSFPFFANNVDWISAHAVDPDNRKSSDPTEAPKHFIDIEDYPEFAPRTLSHNYDTLVAKHGLTFVTNTGVVPWSIIWSFDSLTESLKRGDSAAALQFAADLGHYVGDAHQPLHVTSNYDPNGVHSRYESTMLATYGYLSQVTVTPKHAHFIPVPIDTNFVFIMHGNGLVDSIIHGDTYAKGIDPTYKGSYYAALWSKVGAMTQNQIQDATADLACLWYTAAINAGIVPNAVIPLNPSLTNIAYGKVRVGNFKDTTITITNYGNDSLIVSNISVSGNSLSVTATSANIGPGQTFVDTLRFIPSAFGSAAARIVIASNAASSPDTIQVAGSGTTNALLNLAAHSISFGHIKIGQTKDTAIVVANNGTDTLKISGVVADTAVFTARPSNFALAPGASLSDTITFSPDSVGSVKGFFLISSNSGASPDTLHVDGIGESLTGVPGKQATIPDQFGLSQNYPNPFNPTTVISYQLPINSRVALKVYDILGREVATIVNEQKQAGTYQATFDASRLPSGVYIYRIQAGAFTAMKKLLLIK